jgi:hypothetical protein
VASLTRAEALARWETEPIVVFQLRKKVAHPAGDLSVH